MIQLLLVEFQKHTYHLPTSVQPGFHMITTIAVIAEKKKKFSDRSDHMETTF